MVLEEAGEIVGRRPDLHEVDRVPRAAQRDRRVPEEQRRRPSARRARPGRTPPAARRGGRPARASRRARSRPRGRRRPRAQRRGRAPRRGRAGGAAVSRDPRFCQASRSAGSEANRSSPSALREEPRRELALDAVPGRVERRRERPEPALAGRDRHDPAADAALARQPDVVEPVARGLVEPGASSSRRACAGRSPASIDPLAGERVDAAVGQRRAHHGEIARGDVERSTAACRGRPPRPGRSRAARSSASSARDARGCGGSSPTPTRTPRRRAPASGRRSATALVDEPPPASASARARGSSSRSRPG